MALILAAASSAPAALVHESTFDSPAGTNPLNTTDVTWIWSVDKLFAGSFGHYGYNGTGQLILYSPAHNWDDPYMEYDTSSILPLSSDMEVVLDCLPLFTGNTTNQAVALALTDPVSTPTSFQSNWASGEIALVARSYRGIVRMYFTNTPGSTGGLASVDVPASALTSLRMILTYDGFVGQYKAYYQANGGTVYQFPQTYNAVRNKSVINVTNYMSYSADLEEAYQVELDSLKVYDSIQTTTGEPLPVQERIFNGQSGSTDPFYPITLGDLNQMYKDNAQIYDYNDIGQLVVGHPAVNTGWPNGSIYALLPTTTPVAQLVIDVKPGFTNDGELQMFNIWLGSDLGIFVANAEGSGAGVGIFAWQDDIYALLPADAAVIPVAAASITDLRFVITHFDANDEMRLQWSVNGGLLQEHPNSPQIVPRTWDRVEFQWQVWSATNPSPFTVALDNYAEYDRLLYGEPPLAVSPSWVLYN